MMYSLNLTKTNKIINIYYSISFGIKEKVGRILQDEMQQTIATMLSPDRPAIRFIPICTF